MIKGIKLLKIMVLTGFVAFSCNLQAQISSHAYPFAAIESSATDKIKELAIFEQSLAPLEIVKLEPTVELHAKVNDFFKVTQAYENLVKSLAPEANIIGYGQGRGASALLYALDSGKLSRLKALIIDSPVSLPAALISKDFSKDLPILFAVNTTDAKSDSQKLYSLAEELFKQGNQDIYFVTYTPETRSGFNDILQAFYRQYGMPEAEGFTANTVLQPFLVSQIEFPEISKQAQQEVPWLLNELRKYQYPGSFVAATAALAAWLGDKLWPAKIDKTLTKGSGAPGSLDSKQLPTLDESKKDVQQKLSKKLSQASGGAGAGESSEELDLVVPDILNWLRKTFGSAEEASTSTQTSASSSAEPATAEEQFANYVKESLDNISAFLKKGNKFTQENLEEFAAASRQKAQEVGIAASSGLEKILARLKMIVEGTAKQFDIAQITESLTEGEIVALQGKILQNSEDLLSAFGAGSGLEQSVIEELSDSINEHLRMFVSANIAYLANYLSVEIADRDEVRKAAIGQIRYFLQNLTQQLRSGYGLTAASFTDFAQSVRGLANRSKLSGAEISEINKAFERIEAAVSVFQAQFKKIYDTVEKIKQSSSIAIQVPQIEALGKLLDDYANGTIYKSLHKQSSEPAQQAGEIVEILNRDIENFIDSNERYLRGIILKAFKRIQEVEIKELRKYLVSKWKQIEDFEKESHTIEQRNAFYNQLDKLIKEFRPKLDSRMKLKRFTEDERTIILGSLDELLKMFEANSVIRNRIQRAVSGNLGQQDLLENDPLEIIENLRLNPFAALREELGVGERIKEFSDFVKKLLESQHKKLTELQKSALEEIKHKSTVPAQTSVSGLEAPASSSQAGSSVGVSSDLGWGPVEPVPASPVLTSSLGLGESVQEEQLGDASSSPGASVTSTEVEQSAGLSAKDSEELRSSMLGWQEQITNSLAGSPTISQEQQSALPAHLQDVFKRLGGFFAQVPAQVTVYDYANGLLASLDAIVNGLAAKDLQQIGASPEVYAEFYKNQKGLVARIIDDFLSKVSILTAHGVPADIRTVAEIAKNYVNFAVDMSSDHQALLKQLYDLNTENSNTIAQARGHDFTALTDRKRRAANEVLQANIAPDSFSRAANDLREKWIQDVDSKLNDLNNSRLRLAVTYPRLAEALFPLMEQIETAYSGMKKESEETVKSLKKQLDEELIEATKAVSPNI